MLHAANAELIMDEPLPKWVGAVIGVCTIALMTATIVIVRRWERQRREARVATINRVLNRIALGLLSREEAEKELKQLNLSQDEMLQIVLRREQPGLPVPWYGLPDELEDALKKQKERPRPPE
jgi:hypothetical protein